MSDYYKTQASVEEYIHLARDVNSQQLIDRLKNYLPEGSSLLELGTGPGTDWRILNNDYQVTGSDYSDEFLNHLHATHPSAKFLNIDASTIQTSETFDGIYSNKVLHHLSTEQLRMSINRQSQVVNRGGIICHSFWKGSGDEIFKGMYVNYHDEANLRGEFEQHFEIIELKEYQEFELGDSLYLLGRKL